MKTTGRDEVDGHLDQGDEIVPGLGGVELFERRASGSGSVGESIGRQSRDDGKHVDQARDEQQPFRPRGAGRERDVDGVGCLHGGAQSIGGRSMPRHPRSGEQARTTTVEALGL
jgi:hypothetical protein